MLPAAGAPVTPCRPSAAACAVQGKWCLSIRKAKAPVWVLPAAAVASAAGMLKRPKLLKRGTALAS